ncbi:MAG: penicillin-binding protein [Lachnospiraceae bacterium]|nr:penicillin-binding protein [Lachnospiraceae bacterium]
MQIVLYIIKEIFRGENNRNNIIGFVFSVMFLAVIVRLFNLQIINGEYYEQNYVQKSVKTVTIPAARGNIYDADGNILAYNELVKNITIADVDAYKQNNKDINRRNRMLLSLAKILEKYNCNIASRYFVEIDNKGNFEFTTTSEKQHRTFIANVYGKRVEDLDEGKNFQYRSDISAREAFDYSKHRYAMDYITDDNGNPIIISDQTMLDMIGIHYTMRLTSYQKYQPTTISENVSSRCASEILENLGSLQGVNVEETSARRYNYAIYFAHIVGYVGQTSEAHIERLKETNEQYDLNDKVGLLGLEKSMEKYLCGVKGYKKIVVDSSGKILETLEEKESKAGSDVYITIKVNDQIANYNLLEQRLAGILGSKIVNRDVSNVRLSSSKMEISAHDAYYHLIDNHVLDKDHFAADDAKYAEKEIFRLFLEAKERAKQIIYTNLMDPDADIQMNLSNTAQNFTAYVYTYLHTHNNILMSDAIDRDVEEYIRWKEDTISLRNFLFKAIEETWIDTTKIYSSERYGDRDTIYNSLVSYIMSILDNNEEFDKLVYKFAIKEKYITNRLLIMALFEQGFLPWNDVEYEKISKATDEYMYTYFIRLVRDIVLKPSDLALDPYAGSIVVTDVQTGKLKTLVTYPSYDNNLVYNRKYMESLNNNKSYPLVCCSTQTQLAPGSSFKPITALAALEERTITPTQLVMCDGIFNEIDPPIKCWAYPYDHGELNVVDAISNSCNVVFSIYGHMMSYDQTGNYSTDNGLRILQKYSKMFGLDKKSGVEIDELSPTISYTDPERSAMGQGTHAYNNVQLARYTVALANSGRLYDLSLVEKVVDKQGNVLLQFEPKLVEHLPITEESFNVVHEGMRKMVTDGIAKIIFRSQGLQVCGKTGTAQERNDRTNHAVFVSFAPQYAPEIAVNVVIPFGYSSGNAAALANRVYNYMYGVTSFEEILTKGTDDIKSISVSE